MVNVYETLTKFSIMASILLTSMLVIAGFSSLDPIEPDIYDQWNTLAEFEEVSSLRHFLIEKDWISENVSLDDLDYILVLTQQCSNEFFPTIPSSLALAVISVESGFRQDLVGFSNDTGLMQIIPSFHRERIERYLYDENVDLFDPRLNIMVGMDYLDELLAWARGDLERTIMAYNMGPLKADRLASAGHVTEYAREVLKRMNELEIFFERRYVPCS